MYIGIDVQAARDCPYAVLDEDLVMRGSGWLRVAELERELGGLLSSHPGACFGIDAPRRPLARARRWYWRGGAWRRRAAEDRGRGRHCEVVVKSLKLANPQWTPLRRDAPGWMRHGFTIFDFLEGRAACHEVFPSASYTQLQGESRPAVRLDLAGFRPGPKDMLDAVVAAVTVHELDAGRGVEVGGGDGLGTIVLPREVPRPDSPVLTWPEG